MVVIMKDGIIRMESIVVIMKVGRKIRRFPYPPSIADCGLDSNQPLLPGGISTNSARDQSQSVLQFFDRLHWFIRLLHWFICLPWISLG